MRERNWYILNRWRLSRQLPERQVGTQQTLEELKEETWLPLFDELAKGKLLIGAYRYGHPPTGKYDFIQAIKNKLSRYEETHNLELLVDIRNYAMLEFKKPAFSDAYYHNEDDTEHAPLKK